MCCQRQITPQAGRSYGQPEPISRVGGSGRPYRAWFRQEHRPHAPRSKAPDSSHSARARSSARSMSTSHAASVAASAPARMQKRRWVWTVWELGAQSSELGMPVSGVSGRAACTGAGAWDRREVDALGERGDRARLPPEEDPASREHESSGQSHPPKLVHALF